MTRTMALLLIASLAAGPILGCESKTGTGAVIGAGGGAAVGGLIGSMSHARAGEGAAIGAGAGLLGGALIGHAMDKSDQRQAREQRQQELARERAYFNDGPTYQGQSVVPATTLTRDDLVAWTRSGIKPEIIIDRIERSPRVAPLSAADEGYLRENQVAPEVIHAFRQAASR